MQTIINFGGFYGSIHSQLVDDAVELLCTDDKDVFDQKMYDTFDWKEAYKQYCVAYLDKFEDWLADELDLKEVPKIKFKSIISPRFYNYTTDKISAVISKKNAKEISKAVINSKDYWDYFDEYVEERTTTCDGYIPFYTYKEVMQDKDGILIDFVLEFMAGEYNEKGLRSSIHELNVFEAII